MNGVAVKSGLLTRGFRPPRQKPNHSVILMGIPTRTTAHWSAAGSQRTATTPVTDSFNPYVNWPLHTADRTIFTRALYVHIAIGFVKDVAAEASASCAELLLLLKLLRREVPQ
eukprot:364234-Chlamydomonas_euryale.AAC.16